MRLADWILLVVCVGFAIFCLFIGFIFGVFLFGALALGAFIPHPTVLTAAELRKRRLERRLGLPDQYRSEKRGHL